MQERARQVAEWWAAGRGERAWPGVLLLAVSLLPMAGTASDPASAAAGALPAVLCTAEQTGGFHDYPDDAEQYQPALFHPQPFRLETNPVFMMHLAAGEADVDLYLTMTRKLTTDQGALVSETTELECRSVRGANQSHGFSCVNLPPSEMILINAQTLRFTRTSVGGWTFAAATEKHEGDSIFVEYGQCVATASP
ncbi:MAG TPA: hypothetical protein VIS76_00910 [Pseudomonadales bacterium]